MSRTARSSSCSATRSSATSESASARWSRDERERQVVAARHRHPADASPAVASMATRIDVTLEGLHQLRERIDRQQLEGDDWVVIGALVSTFIARTEARQARLRAKAEQQAAQEKAKQTAAEPAGDVGHSPGAEDTAATGESS